MDWMESRKSPQQVIHNVAPHTNVYYNFKSPAFVLNSLWIRA